MVRFAVTLKIERPDRATEYETAVLADETAELAGQAVLSAYLQARPFDRGYARVLHSRPVH